MHDPLTLAYLAGVMDSDGYTTVHKSVGNDVPTTLRAWAWREPAPSRPNSQPQPAACQLSNGGQDAEDQWQLLNGRTYDEMPFPNQRWTGVPQLVC